MALPGAFSHSDLARCGRTVQTDCGGHSLGRAAAPADHGGFYFCVRQGGQVAFRRRGAVSIDGFCCHAAVADVRYRHRGGRQQFGSQ